jgi:tripartite-type tricarboxylate transporter receptor subunit TctC
MKLTKALATAVAIAGFAGMATAEDSYPDQPIKLVLGFGAGGGSDGLARAVQAAVEKHDLLPVPLVVVNAEGASGVVGMRQVLNAKPDGYTILQIHQEMFAAGALGRADFTPADFEPVLQATNGCMFMAVPKDSQFNTLDELITYAKEHPGELKQADAIGGVTHFPSIKLMQEAGADWTVVPSGGTSKRFAAMKGGFADMALMSPPWLEKGANDLRPLAAFSDERFDTAPDLPTAKELGYDVTSCLTRRFWAPKGTPQEHIDVLADALEAALKSEEVTDYLGKLTESVAILRGDALSDAVKKEYQSFVDVADMVRAAGNK